MPTDAEIASRAHLLPIPEVAAKLGIPVDALEMYGPFKAKLSRTFLHNLQERPSGKLVLVTAISPTPAGEGKSTTVVGLADALNRIGKRAAVCLREPSLGPCFGMKGGATGGGMAQVVPMEDINLHFTGDMHAITTAHNLLTALIDNHIHHGNALDIDPRRIIWRRVMDLNDRALRQIVTGGEGNRYKRKAHFDITVASEVMAILCLATSIPDLRHRLGEILVAYTRDGQAIYAKDLHAQGAMAALLKDAIKPNLVQTMEHTPAFIHGGPFANIAHGCNSIAATQAALKLADYVVTEAGFGADLGAEKFIDIKCRKAGLWPDVAVLVATVRALKFHGGVEKGDLDQENLPALRNGIANLRRHLENLQGLFGLPVVVAINPFPTDTEAELAALQEEVARLGATAIISRHWAEGSAGATELAAAVAAAADASTSQPQFLYDNDLPLWKKIETIAKRVYRAEKVVASESVKRQLRKFDAEYRHFPICMAKTQYSFSSSPTLRGAPEGHEIKVTEVRLSRGAGFVVVVCGNIMTMPGLPKVPASMHISLSDEGIIAGLS